MTWEDVSADLPLEPEARVRMRAFGERLLARNATTNLTAARDPLAVAQHIRDSLSLAAFVRAPHVDLGSGGGFPAIPLAIVTRTPMTLVESIAKKATFLREIVAELNLEVEVVTDRAEDVGRDPRYRERFASASARAVGSVTMVLELAIPFLVVGGVALLQRGDLSTEERDAAADALLVLGGEATAEFAVDSDGRLGEASSDWGGRRVIIVTKRTPTAARFPRRAGIPAKRPLGVAGLRRAGA